MLRVLRYYQAHIYELDETGKTLKIVGGTGESERTMVASGHSIAVGRGLIGRAAKTNSVVLVPDVSQAQDWVSNTLSPNTKSEVAVPITIDGQVLGVLDVQHNVSRGLKQEDADMLQSIANQVGVALQNARLFEREKRQAKRRALINAISQKIQNTSTVEGVLQIAAQELGQALGARRASVELGISTSNTNGDK